MNKQRIRRTPLAAVIGLLAVLIVPAVAQAHHIDTTASCVLVDNVATVKYDVKFVGFSATAKDDTTGTVKIDGVTAATANDIDWSSEPGVLSGSKPAGPGAHDVVASFDWKSGHQKKTVTTNECPTPKEPAIALDKTGAATAVAGSTFTYSFKATNTGNVTLTNVTLTDDRCESTLTRVEPNLADQSFDKGDEWFYSCTVTAPAGPAQVDNVAKVCGDYSAPGVKTQTVCDEDPHTFTVPPPNNPPSDNPPAQNPPASTPNAVPVASAGGGVLPVSVASGRAALRGPSGCVRKAFRARVQGRSIASVTFSVDGKKVKTVRGKSAFSFKVRPGRYGFGRHKIVARVRFSAASGTKARSLPLTFRRCAQGTVAPRFTG